jgi:hypothetical protein
MTVYELIQHLHGYSGETIVQVYNSNDELCDIDIEFWDSVENDIDQDLVVIMED